ncbi:MAG: HAD family hydrolase [Selenomonadaceae bacterium]
MKTLIFDMDGVIADSELIHYLTNVETFRQYGIPFEEEELFSYMGRTSWALFEETLKKQQLENLDAAELLECKRRLYIEILTKEPAVRPIEGIVDLLISLKLAGIKTAVASSTGREVTELVLEKLGVKECFDAVFGGDETTQGKPDPEIYLLAAQKLGEDPAQCCVIEDAAVGVAAAKQAGMYCIAYSNPASGPQDLSLADEVVESLADISVERFL